LFEGGFVLPLCLAVFLGVWFRWFWAGAIACFADDDFDG